MKNGAIALGALLSLIGLVWIGQGVGLIKGSFMTGSAFWGLTGAALLLVGVALIGFGARTRRSA